MQREQIRAEFDREPFVPLRIHLADGRRIDVRFSHVVVFMHDGIMIFKGVRSEGSHVAKGYEFVAYDKVSRVEPKHGNGGGQRRRKAS